MNYWVTFLLFPFSYFIFSRLITYSFLTRTKQKFKKKQNFEIVEFKATVFFFLS